MKEERISWVDLQFVDLVGALQHISVPAHTLDEKDFEIGVGKLDGSSIKGFKEIFESDMLLLPIAETYRKIPWEQDTARIFCGVKEVSGSRFSKDSRHTAENAEKVLAQNGFDTSYWGPEAEFFVFDEVHYDTTNPHRGQGYSVGSIEAAWNPTGKGYPIGFKGGYYPVPPADTLQDLRRRISDSLQNDFGIRVEAHHHEVATAGQCEINMRFDKLTCMADNLLTFKYVVKNLAYQSGKIATFMPKPMFGDNGSGMHTNQSMWNAGRNQFYDANETYAQLSQNAIYYIGGLVEHGRSLAAFCNPTTNSYRRLVPGYEAPVYLAYSKSNRSACIRIPYYFSNEVSKRLEYRAPDPTANPYLAFAALAAAGLDGIKKKIMPPAPVDANIYHMTVAERRQHGIKELPGALLESLHELESDRDFLKPIFADDLVDSYLTLKYAEANAVGTRPHPYEFDLYLNS
ncbi:type I glutamate--ammonia ligase [Candidatus Micrarchaeota archaeon]|nr:type I glutamate--ammonia ligase [Candidatus Micrarchaeota archaeon]